MTPDQALQVVLNANQHLQQTRDLLISALMAARQSTDFPTVEASKVLMEHITKTRDFKPETPDDLK